VHKAVPVTTIHAAAFARLDRCRETGWRESVSMGIRIDAPYDYDSIF